MRSLRLLNPVNSIFSIRRISSTLDYINHQKFRRKKLSDKFFNISVMYSGQNFLFHTNKAKQLEINEGKKIY